MYYVYMMKSLKQEAFYIGYTNNLKQRLKTHNLAKSLSTKKYAPWQLVYFEGYANILDAQDREKRLKQFGRVYSQLKRRIWRSLQS